MKKTLLLLTIVTLSMNNLIGQSITFTSPELTTAEIGNSVTVDYEYTIPADGYIYCAINLLDDWTWNANVASAELNPAVAGTNVTGSFTLAIPNGTTPSADLTGNLNYKINIELSDSGFNWLAGQYPATQIQISSPSLSIEDVNEDSNKLNIYPNPAYDKLSLSGLNDNLKSIKIMNLLGEIVYSEFTTLKDTDIDISNLTSGLYVLSAKYDNSISTIKFIKK